MPNITSGIHTENPNIYDNSDSPLTIQERIDTMHLRGAVVLPLFEEETSTTIITPNRTGGVVLGHGAFISADTSTGNLYASSRSSIVAKAHMTDLLRIRGAKQHWSDFNLMGDAWNTVTDDFDKYGTKPDVGLMIYYDAGVGAGKHIFDNVNIQGFTTGVKFGQLGTSNNCDVTTVRNLRIENCDIGVWQLGNQAIQNVFEGIIITQHHIADPAAGEAGTGICFLFNGGGNFRADDCTMVSPGIFHKIDQLDGSYLGSNTSHYEYNNVKIDNGAGAGAKLFDSVPSTYLKNLTTKAIFRNVYFAYDSYASVGANGSRMGTVHGMQEVVIEHGYNLQPGAFNWRSYSGESSTFRRVLRLYNCKLRGCTLATDVLKHNQSTGTMYFQAVNCTGLNNEHIDDYSGVVTGTGS